MGAYFYHFIISLCNFWDILFVHCTVGVYSLYLKQFRGSWIPFQVGWWRGNLNLSREINEGFLFVGWSSMHLNSHLSPHSLIPSSPFPHTLIWWRTCWSDSCALMRIVDAQDLIYDVWLCNIISICSVSRNIRNTCMKGLHSHALE